MCLCLEERKVNQQMEETNPIKSYEDLITPYEQTRAGFLSLALEKNKQSTPFIEEAKVLKTFAHSAKTPMDLLKIPQINNSLLAASGLSNKALGHLNEQDKKKAILDLIKNFLEPTGNDFVDELVYRFLLTRGDSLGGSMRNIAGKIGEWRFIRILLSTLSISSYKCKYLEKGSSNKWKCYSVDPDIEKKIKVLNWVSPFGNRILVFNKIVPIIGKNVDLILLDSSNFNSGVLQNTEKYLALGEIKGGIDPAGADEHWKTANSALDRIRKGFLMKNSQPYTFFISAAIENSMAKEIFEQLQNGIMTKAANLTNVDQVVNLCSWLISL